MVGEGNVSANTVKFTYFILLYEAPLRHSIILVNANAVCLLLGADEGVEEVGEMGDEDYTLHYAK